jgi:hypothetical protein
MLFINQALETLYQNGRLDARDLLYVSWPGGSGGLWSDTVDVEFPFYPGVTFRGVYGFVELTIPAQTMGRDVKVYQVSVNPLDSRVVALMRGFPLHQTELVHLHAGFDPDTKQLAGAFEAFSGTVERSIETERGDKTALVFEVTSRARDFARSGNRFVTHKDQLRHDPNDDSFKFVSASVKRITQWGGKS